MKMKMLFILKARTHHMHAPYIDIYIKFNLCCNRFISNLAFATFASSIASSNFLPQYCYINNSLFLSTNYSESNHTLGSARLYNIFL
jgi:hypothetical protein